RGGIRASCPVCGRRHAAGKCVAANATQRPAHGCRSRTRSKGNWDHYIDRYSKTHLWRGEPVKGRQNEEGRMKKAHLPGVRPSIRHFIAPKRCESGSSFVILER